MSQSPTGAITGMANGHDNLLDLPPRAPEVSEAVAPRGFDIFLQQHYKGLVQFLRQLTVPEQYAEDAAPESLPRLLRSREPDPARAGNPLLSSEDRREGKEGFSPFRSGWSPDHTKK